MELSRLFLPSFNKWRCLRCLFFFRWKTEKHSCRSSVNSMRSCPPQYPRSSTLLKPIPLPLYFFSFLYFFLPPLFSHFPPSFPHFLFVLCFFLLSFFPDPPSFFLVFPTCFSFFCLIFLIVFFGVCACVCVCILYRTPTKCQKNDLVLGGRSQAGSWRGQ